MRVLRVYSLLGVLMLFCLGLSGQKVSLFQLRNAPDSTYVIGAGPGGVAKWVKKDSLGLMDSIYINGVWYSDGDTVTITDTYVQFFDGGSLQTITFTTGETIVFDPFTPEYAFLENVGGGYYRLKFTPTVIDTFERVGNKIRLSLASDNEFTKELTLDNTNQLGNLTIEGDSIYYQKCPYCIDSLIGVIVHPTTIDSTTVSSTTTVTLTEVANVITATVNDGSITPAKLDRVYVDSTAFKVQNLETNLVNKTTKGYRTGDLAIGPNSKFENTGSTLTIKGENDTKALEIKPDSLSDGLTYISLNAKTLQEYDYPNFDVIGREFDVNENMDAPNMVFRMGYNPSTLPPEGQVGLEDAWEYSYNLNQAGPVADTVVERHIEFWPRYGRPAQRLMSYAASWNGLKTEYAFVSSLTKNKAENGDDLVVTDHRTNSFSTERWYNGLQLISENALYPITVENKLRILGAGQLFNDDGNALYFGLNTNRNDFTFYGNNNNFFRLKNDQNTTGFGFGFNGLGWFGLTELATGATPITLKQGASHALLTLASDRIGINQQSPSYNLDVTGSARLTDWTGTGTVLTGRNAAGKMVDFGIGSGFSISSGTLNFTEGDSSPTNEKYGNFLPSTRIAFGSPTDTITSSPYLTWATNTFSVTGIADILRTGNNTFISGGNQTQTGTENIALGYNSLRDITTANANIAIGYEASNKNTTASNQIGIGYQALKDNLVGTGNIAIGDRALTKNLANSNQAIGNQALQNNTTGANNVAVGNIALHVNVSGSNNTAIGGFANYGTQGSNNIAIGLQTLFSTGAKTNTTAVGTFAGFSNVNGDGNVFLGYGAAYNELGSNKLYIENSISSTPLVGGDFSANRLGINRDITSLGATLHVGGNVKIDNLTATPTKIGALGAGNELTRLKLGNGLSISDSTLHVATNLDNDSLNEIQHVDSLGFSATNTIGASLSKDETVKTLNARRYEHHLNSGEVEKADNVVFIGDLSIPATNAETDLRDKGLSVFRYSPDNVTLLGGSVKVDGFAGLNAVIRISPTDSIRLTHYGKNLNVYARGTSDSIRIRSYDADTSFSYAILSNAKTGIEYTNTTSFVGKVPTYDKLWTSVIKADAELYVHGIVVVGYSNIIDQTDTGISLDSLYAARWVNGWNQVVFIPSLSTDTTGIKTIIANNVEGTIITNNESLIRPALNKDWSVMRLTTEYNSYERATNEVLEDALNENANVYDGITAVKGGKVFLKEGNKRYFLKRGEITGTDTLSIDGTNIYNSNGTIYNTFRTVELDSAFLSISSETDYTTFEIGDGTGTYQQIEGYVSNDDFSRTASLKLTDTEASLARTGSGITIADSVSLNLSGSTGTAGQLATATGTGKMKWQTPNFLTGVGTATRLTFWDGSSSLSSSPNAYWDNTNSRLGLGTSTPFNRLDLVGDLGMYKSGAPAQIYLGDGNFANSSYYNSAPGIGAAGASAPYGDLAFFRYAGVANSRSEIMRIDADGLGIFTTNPTAALHVNGTAKIVGGVTLDQLAGTNTRIVTTSSTGVLDDVAITANYLSKGSTSTGLTTSQIFDNGTNVGINDATPGAKLDVNGDIRANDFTGGSLVSYIGRDANGQFIDAATPTSPPFRLTVTSGDLQVETTSGFTFGNVVTYNVGTMLNSTSPLFTSASGFQKSFTSGGPSGGGAINFLLDLGTGLGRSGNRIVNTGDTNAADDLTTSTSHSGDVSGLYNNLQIGNSVVGNTEMANDAIGSAEIINGSIAAADLSSMSASTGQVMQWNGSSWVATTPSGGSPTGSAGGDLSGTYPNPSVAASAINSAKILDNTITASDINTGGVATAEILDGTVRPEDIHTTLETMINTGAIAICSGMTWSTGSRLNITSGNASSDITVSTGSDLINLSSASGTYYQVTITIQWTSIDDYAEIQLCSGASSLQFFKKDSNSEYASTYTYYTSKISDLNLKLLATGAGFNPVVDSAVIIVTKIF